ncbi:MAG: rhodanese-like domain-containing protein [Candidatus Kapabacteria bacterium]|nr:rhodanese-like domain-containing protein [Candidatus Kapabacteria bacterium]
MKELFKEIFIIVVIATALAFGYNAFSGFKVPFIYQKPIENYVPDSLLFKTTGLISQTANSLSASRAEISNPTSTVSQDTISKVKVPTEKVISVQAASAATQKIPDANKPTLSEYKIVSYQQLLKIIGNPNFVMIDARQAESYNLGHIANALNIYPLGSDIEFMPKVMSLPRDKNILIYCDGGACELSHDLAKILIDAHFSNIFIYTGGWEEWIKMVKK